MIKLIHYENIIQTGGQLFFLSTTCQNKTSSIGFTFLPFFYYLLSIFIVYNYLINDLEIESQPVRKVVDLKIRNPTKFSLYFSDFSLNCYGILKSAAKITKGSLYVTIHLSLKLCRQPPGLLYLLTRGPWLWSEREAGV
jgi:hypothetical protein